MVDFFQAGAGFFRRARREPDSLRDRVVVITGASSGIGRAAALAFSAQGSRVVVAARRQAELEALVAEITQAGGVARAVPTDVTKDADLERLVAEARGAFGRIDVLVNNAGLAHGGLLHELEPELLHQTLNVNLHGTFRLTQLVVPLMLAQGRGHIVTISSVVAYMPLPALAVYNATKAALVSFTSSLRRELLGTGVHASVVLPGATRTAMIETALREYESRHGAEQPLALKALLQLIVGPEVVAREIVDAVREPRRERMMGGPSVSVAALAEKLFPGLVEAGLARLDPAAVAGLIRKIGG